jgi:cell fate (sporulation/competence/biofilm development) regulator YlbF (YheA/YmcA/DUF963 family)
MENETATPEMAPVETPVETDALENFLNEPDNPESDTPELSGDADEAPATEEDAQKAEEPTEEGTPEEQPKYKVKVRGEEVEVPLDELLKGYSRTEDYKAKTAEVAEARRAAATEYADKLEHAARLFESLDPVLSQTRNIDWTALAQTDPATYIALKAQHEQRVATLQQTYGEIDQIRQAEAQREQQALEEESRQERELLVKALPELAEPEKLTSFASGIVDYLKKTGFSDDEIATTNNHLALILADKARRWDEYQRAKETVVNKKAAIKPQQTLTPRAAEAPRAPRKPGPTASEQDRRDWVLAQLDAE